MLYILVEKGQFKGVLDYKPNTGTDKIDVIEYKGTVPRDFVHFLNGKVVDIRNYTSINGELIEKNIELETQDQVNRDARTFLNDTDWLSLRQYEQQILGIETSLSNEEYIELLRQRQEARAKVVTISNSVGEV